MIIASDNTAVITCSFRERDVPLENKFTNPSLPPVNPDAIITDPSIDKSMAETRFEVLDM
jgi:hypothetical protein